MSEIAVEMAASQISRLTGGQRMAVQADVANAEDVERLFKESMDAFGRPDVVVHCAGIMPLFPIASGERSG